MIEIAGSWRGLFDGIDGKINVERWRPLSRRVRAVALFAPIAVMSRRFRDPRL